MTCIVGIVDKQNECAYIGGDSGASRTGHIVPVSNPKVFRVGQFIIGCTTSFRMIQLLKFSFNPPNKGNKEIYKYMCTDFINEIRDLFKSGGFSTIDNNEEIGGSFLVGYKDRLFNIQSDFSVNECLSGYYSVGCGMEYALGSIYSNMDSDNDTKGIVINALDAAANFSTGVCEPFHVLKTK